MWGVCHSTRGGLPLQRVFTRHTQRRMGPDHTMPDQVIRITGARQHNLKNLNLDIPLNRITVVTGVSGSGKSSLAFDTLYAEGQRRYIETFSPYARQFMDRMDRPQVDKIEGIPPAIAIDSKDPVRTSRSTVGTMTEITDYVKLLYARLGRLHCRACGRPVRAGDSGARLAPAPGPAGRLPGGHHLSLSAERCRPRGGARRPRAARVRPSLPGRPDHSPCGVEPATGRKRNCGRRRPVGLPARRKTARARFSGTRLPLRRRPPRLSGCRRTDTTPSAADWSAPSARSPTAPRCRACSRSTARSAPATPAGASAAPSASTWT